MSADGDGQGHTEGGGRCALPAIDLLCDDSWPSAMLLPLLLDKISTVVIDGEILKLLRKHWRTARIGCVRVQIKVWTAARNSVEKPDAIIALPG